MPKQGKQTPSFRPARFRAQDSAARVGAFQEWCHVRCLRLRRQNRAERSRSLLDAVLGEPRIQKAAASRLQRQGHALHLGRRPEDSRCRGRSLVHERRTQPRADRGSDPEAGGGNGFRAVVSVFASEGLHVGDPHCRTRAGRSRSCFLLQFGIGSGRYRAENRARLS